MRLHVIIFTHANAWPECHAFVRSLVDECEKLDIDSHVSDMDMEFDLADKYQIDAVPALVVLKPENDMPSLLKYGTSKAETVRSVLKSILENIQT